VNTVNEQGKQPVGGVRSRHYGASRNPFLCLFCLCGKWTLKRIAAFAAMTGLTKTVQTYWQGIPRQARDDDTNDGVTVDYVKINIRVGV
jgi:hypothetical protein